MKNLKEYVKKYYKLIKTEFFKFNLKIKKFTS